LQHVGVAAVDELAAQFGDQAGAMMLLVVYTRPPARELASWTWAE
jgi:hypothetical protein